MNKLPKARGNNIVVQELKDETLIYDLKENKAFCLNETAGIVFSACNGRTDFDELKKQSGFSDDLIYLTLDELKRQGLIEDEYHSPFAGMKRREVIRKIGFASMIALPLITGLVAPTAAMAASGTAGTAGACTSSAQCQPGLTCTSCSGGSCGTGRQACCIPGSSVGPGGIVNATGTAVTCAVNARAQCCSGMTSGGGLNCSTTPCTCGSICA